MSLKSNAIANHEVWEFPNSANPNTISEQDKTWEISLNQVYTWNATWSRESWVAYNGVKYELETNERVTCESGETYRIEAKQSMFDVIWLDQNNAHVQPTWEYHYHWVPNWLIDTLEWEDVVHVWYANDWFPIYYSKQETYTPSYELSTVNREWTSCQYVARTTTDVVIDWTIPDWTYDLDWEYVEWLGNLDSCNWTYVDWEYWYFITEDFPYWPRCLNWEVKSQWGKWPSWWERQRWSSWTLERMWPPPRQ